MDTAKTEDWVEEVLDEGDRITRYLLSQDPDDSFGWGKLLQKMWTPEATSRPSGSGLLLVGPPGCGKHTAVHHLVHALAARNYHFVFLDGEELGELGGKKDACDALTALFDHCYDEQQSLCLVLEQLAELPFSRAVFRFLGTNLMQYYLHWAEDIRFEGPKDHPFWRRSAEDEEDEFTPLFLILIEEKEPAIPAFLRNRLQLCRMSLPDALRRRRYLSNSELGRVRPVDGLVEETEGLTYAQLEDLINSLRCQAEDAYRADEAETLLTEQLPPVNEMRLARLKALDSLGRLPEAMASMPVRSQERVQEPDSEKKKSAQADHSPGDNTEDSLADRRKKLEEMPVRDLLVETFGEEDAAQVLNSFD